MAKIHLIIQIKDKTPQIFVFFFLDFKLWMKRNCAILHNNRFFLFFRFICLLLYIVCGIDTRFFFSRRVFVQNCILTSMVCHFCYKYSYVFNCNRFRLSIQVLKGHVSLLLLPFRPWMSFRKDTKRIGQSNKKKNGYPCSFIHHPFHQLCSNFGFKTTKKKCYSSVLMPVFCPIQK